jgi:GT2 family glycosyltransferase
VRLPVAPHVAVVLVNWNGRRFLEAFLPALTATEYPHHEILVWDNGSSDGSVEWLRERYPGIRVVEGGRNYGFTGGNNRALAFVSAPLVALINTDVEVTPGWLAPLVERIASDENIAAVQPKILSQLSPSKFEYAGAAGGWMDRWGYPFCRGRIFDDVENDVGQYDLAQRVFWTSGACMLVRRSVIDQIGLFDESYFAHWEEIDFCWRAQNAGYELWCEPRSTVYHVGGGTLQTGDARKTYLNFRNSLLTLVKNLPVREACLKLAMRTVLDAVVIVKAVLSGRFRYAGAVCKAQYDFWRHFPQTWNKRLRQARAPMRSLAGVWRGSVVWAYFAEKKKRFSQIVYEIS